MAATTDSFNIGRASKPSTPNPKIQPPTTACRLTTQHPITSISILVRKKQSSASSGLHNTGSFSLNDVFSTIGTPMRSLARVGVLINRLQPARAVYMRHRRDQRPLLFTNLVDLHHEGQVVVLLKQIWHRIAQH